MIVREMLASEEAEVLGLMRKLWPDCDDEVIPDDVVFVIAREGKPLEGFLALSWRSYAEGCTDARVAYVEGWWIDEAIRRRGAGGALMAAAEAWALARGATELASDSNLANAISIAAHGQLGFEEVTRIACFRKPLGRLDPSPTVSIV
jgi:aminoglycoside 6'-N-acetyltransferase I